MHRPLVAVLTVAALLFGGGHPAGAADQGAADQGAAVLTVTGDIAHPNRGPYDAFRDVFFKFHDKYFDKAFALDRAALQALPQVTVTAQAASWPAPVQATGPRLKDVLAAAGVAERATVMAFALDGYGVEFTSADRAAHDWVVAIDTDGQPLGLGGRGPTWLLYETGAAKASDDDEAKWVWSAFVLTVE